ncbi:microtubule-associated tumor suppressor candidate 2 isoform X2 [Esox lucius]|nr:microtubule-associated tumor suppressor candidate 2 isoform X2 [Esox lucius]
MSRQIGESVFTVHVGEVKNNNQNQHFIRGVGGGGVISDGDSNANQITQTGESGDATSGDATSGDATSGDAPAGDAPAGDAPAGDAPAGDAPAGDATARDAIGRDVGSLKSVSQMTTVIKEPQDKIIIWGTDSQCDDPELAEFEMLECQELEAYLVEEEEEGVMQGKRVGNGNILLDQPVSVVGLVSNQSSKREQGGSKTILQDPTEQDAATVSHLSGTWTMGMGVVDCVAKAEFSSDNDVFVSCLSTVSSLGGSLANALDTAGQTQATTTDSWPVPSGPNRTIADDLTLASQSSYIISDCRISSQQSRKHQAPFKSTIIEAGQPQAESRSTIQRAKQPQVPHESTTQKGELDLNQNKSDKVADVKAQASNGVIVGQCKSQTNMREQGHKEHNQNLELRYREVGGSAEEDKHVFSPDVNHNSPAKSVTKRIQSVESKDFKKQDSFEKQMKKQGSFEQTMKKTTSFEQSTKKTTSFENTTKKSASFDRSLRKEPSFDRTLGKQGSFERSASPSSLEGRKPWGSRSPSRPATPPWSPRKQAPNSPAKTSTRPALSTSPSKTSNRASSQDTGGSPQRGIPTGLRVPSKVCVTSSIPKPMSPLPPAVPRKSSPTHQPKTARPKIITYVRKSPQVQVQSQETEIGQYESSTLPPRLPTSQPSPPAAQREPHKVGTHSKASQVLCSSNTIFDKYRQEMQKAGFFPAGTGMTSLGIKPPSHPPSHRLSGKSGSFHGELPNRYMLELGLAPPVLSPQEGTGMYCSPRPRGPQLGLGAVTRQPAAPKARNALQGPGQMGQRSGVTTLSHPGQPGTTQGHHDPTVDHRRPGPEATQSRIFLPKAGQSGLRHPGFSALPPARLATFGFVRSSSISSVSSNQSTDSSHSDPCRPSQPSRKADQRAVDVVQPTVSSPKRFAVVPPKPHSPVRRSKTGCGGLDFGGQEDKCDLALVQQLRERCDKQARQIHSLQTELNKASLGLQVFSITTQHFHQKSESAIVKERELSLELTKIRDEVASSVLRWEALQQDKEALERRFEGELVDLHAQQQSELAVLEERLRLQHNQEVRRLEAQQKEQLDTLRVQHLEQMEEMTENHESVLTEMESNHNDTLATLKEEHARTIKNLKMAHDQQRKSLEEEFEKLRLSLQDQVDTLTFQNRSLRDRAKRFEEALCRSTEEQIVEALAPYQHIEEDLKSLKEVLEMKNKQIHEQDIKISELERMAQKNVFLEERVQVLQQQNEDLRARIDKNLALSRHLSEENANLQESVEKESNEKKRLSRNNEELLWRLQTGELSPHMSPTGSPIHRASPILHGSNSSSPINHRSSPGPASPARPHSYHQ